MSSETRQEMSDLTFWDTVFLNHMGVGGVEKAKERADTAMRARNQARLQAINYTLSVKVWERRGPVAEAEQDAQDRKADAEERDAKSDRD